MADWSVFGGSNVCESWPQSGSSYGLLITTGTTAHVKTAWSTLITSTSFDCSAIMLKVWCASYALFDFAVGASGQEQVFAENIPSINLGSSCVAAGVRIPAGSRIAVRVQAAGASSNTRSSIALLRGNEYLPETRYLIGLGVSTATSEPKSVTAGGTVNTKGSWVELVASLAADVKALHLAPYNIVNARSLLDLGFGVAASEVVAIPNFCASTYGGTSWTHTGYARFGINIAAGTRLAARAQSSTASTVSRFCVVGEY